MTSQCIKVVAISGVSGCGKTTLLKALAKHFNSPYLAFDDFVEATTYPKDMQAWYAAGANVSKIKTPKFTTALRDLCKTGNHQLLFIEEPFGRQRTEMAAYIDYVILLDTPLELCLSRVIMRNLQKPNCDSLTSIPNYLERYNHYLRDIYIECRRQIKQNCDLVISAEQPVQSVLDTLTSKLELL